MDYNNLTQKKFNEFKKNYDVYGTHLVKDEYRNEQLVTDDEPKCSIYVMWQPVTDEVSVRLYGVSVKEMFSCVYYGDEEIEEHDQIIIDDWKYEVVSIKQWHTHKILMIKRLLKV